MAMELPYTTLEETPEFCRITQPGLGGAVVCLKRQKSFEKIHSCMKIRLTGHKGYIGAVAGPVLRDAGHEVVGLDTDLFAGCEFGPASQEIPEVRKDLRSLTKADLESFDAVVHLAALSNDPLGNLNAAGLTCTTSTTMHQCGWPNWRKKRVCAASSSPHLAARTARRETTSWTRQPQLTPVTAYAESKVYVERDVARSPTTISAPPS